MYCRHKALATMYLQASGNYHSVMRKGLKNGTICIIVMVPLGNTNSLHQRGAISVRQQNLANNHFVIPIHKGNVL